MKLACHVFGHKPPIYSTKGWYSPGEEYATVILGAVDGCGRQHAIIFADCARCGASFKLARIHIPPTGTGEKK
jgi:hypothetical protein